MLQHPSTGVGEKVMHNFLSMHALDGVGWEWPPVIHTGICQLLELQPLALHTTHIFIPAKVS